jgi:hypothetical protein
LATIGQNYDKHVLAMELGEMVYVGPAKAGQGSCRASG